MRFKASWFILFFYEILNKIRTENLFSSQEVELFSSCVGGKFEVELSFLQFTSVFGRQLDSKYDNGFKFDCVTNDQQEVIVLFPEGCKELVEELRNEKSHELKIHKKPILGYLDEEWYFDEPEPQPEPIEHFIDF